MIYSSKKPNYGNKAKRQWRERIYQNTLANHKATKGFNIMLFDADDGYESKFWLSKFKRSKITSVECDLATYNRWTKLKHVKDSMKIQGFKGKSTEYLENIKSFSHDLINLDYVGFMSKDKFKDFILINEGLLSLYVVINVQHTKKIRHHKNVDLKEETRNVEDVNLYYINKYFTNYNIVDDFVYRSSRKPMRTFVLELINVRDAMAA